VADATRDASGKMSDPADLINRAVEALRAAAMTLVHLLRIRMECKSAEQAAGKLTLAAYQEPICNRAPVDTPPLSTMPSGRMMDSLAETIR
jgi:hypothetical protein